MLLFVKLAVWTVCLLPRSRHELVFENLALRQQLATLAHKGRRPRLLQVDRLFWIALRDLWPGWITALAIVKPATVVAWHRRAFRGYSCGRDKVGKRRTAKGILLLASQGVA